jgi:hypothetical protein
MKQFAVVLVLAICFSFCQPLSAQEETINVNCALVLPQITPAVAQYTGLSSLVLACGMVRTPNNVSLARIGFKARMIYPEIEKDWKNFGLADGEEVALKKPKYDVWWREEFVGLLAKESRSGIYEYYMWMQYVDAQGQAFHYRSKEDTLAFINDPQSLPVVVCRGIKTVSTWQGLYCQANTAVVGMPLESYSEVEGRGCYLYFDIYEQDSSEPVISRNAGRIQYGWKEIGVLIPRYEFEEKSIVGKNLTIKTRIVQAVNEKTIPSYFGFSQHESAIRKLD